MSKRTGTQLIGTDMAAVETALNTQIATPTKANFDTLVAALVTVEANAKDSVGVTATNKAAGANDIRAIAKSLRRALLDIERNFGVTTAARFSKFKIRNISGGSARTLWEDLAKHTTTTD
jgi:hypothetical protein